MIASGAQICGVAWLLPLLYGSLAELPGFSRLLGQKNFWTNLACTMRLGSFATLAKREVLAFTKVPLLLTNISQGL